MHRLHLENITCEQAAAKFGVSVRAISEFRSINDDTLVARMRAGEISLWEAKRLVAQAELEQAQAAAKEAQRNLREKRKAATSTGANNDGDKEKAKPSKKATKKCTWDPKASKATRAYAIKTLQEQGFPTDDEALIQRTIEEYRTF